MFPHIPNLRLLLLASICSIFFLMLIFVAPAQQSSDSTPTLFIEEGTDICLTTYEPTRQSFHACWPVAPADRRGKIVPRGTTALNIFEDPDKYLNK